MAESISFYRHVQSFTLQDQAKTVICRSHTCLFLVFLVHSSWFLRNKSYQHPEGIFLDFTTERQSFCILHTIKTSAIPHLQKCTVLQYC